MVPTSGCPRKRWTWSGLRGSIKGPLTTPVGGGIRSLNVALRQQLDLYVCLRPVRYFKGVPSPVREPEKTDMVIFRENSEDIYAGIEYMAESEQAKELIQFLQTKLGVKKIRFPATSSIGIKPVSREAPSGWCARPCSTPSTMTAPRSRWCTRATS